MFVILALLVFLGRAGAVFSQPLQVCRAGCPAAVLTDSDVVFLRSLNLPLDTLAAIREWFELAVQLIYLTIAAAIFWRRSDNWIALIVSLTMLTFGPLAILGVQIQGPPQGAPDWSELLANRGATLSFGFFFASIYLFPNGRFAPRWAVIASIPWAGWLFVTLFGPIFVTLGADAIPDNPLVLIAILSSLVAVVIGGLASQILRYFRVSSPAQRQQTKWAVLGFLAVLVVAAVNELFPLGDWLPRQAGVPRTILLFVGYPLMLLFTLVLPLSFAFSILRYRLWDIDVIINRTLVYAVLTAILVSFYVGLAFALSRVAVLVMGPTVSGNPNIAALSALAAAALAYPLRVRLQRTLDALIFRRRLARARFLQEALEQFERARPPDAVAAFLENRAAERLELVGTWLLLPPEAGRMKGQTERSLPGPTGPLMERMEKITGPVALADESERGLSPAPELAADDAGLAAWHAAGARLIIPLNAGSRSADSQETGDRPSSGLWVVGRRRDAQLFDRDDLAVFTRVAQQAAVVVDYALLHHQLDRAKLLQRYLSPQLAESILAGTIDANLGSSRKSLTVLFSDIRGFTAMSERMEPEELLDLLNQYLTAMTDIVFENGGTLDKYIGDALMVFIGDPVDYVDHQARAVRMAFAMRAKLREMQRQWTVADGELVNIGIGISTGYVTVGNIGSPARTEYTVLGNHVNLASRLADRAAPGQILVSERTLLAVHDLVVARQIDEVELKGVSRPIKIFEIDEQPNGLTDADHGRARNV